MKQKSSTADLERLLNPLSECFSTDVAEALIALRADSTTQARLDELAEKSTAGTLTLREKSEYQSFVSAIDVIGILQSKARRFLAKIRSSSTTPNCEF